MTSYKKLFNPSQFGRDTAFPPIFVKELLEIEILFFSTLVPFKAASFFLQLVGKSCGISHLILFLPMLSVQKHKYFAIARDS